MDPVSSPTTHASPRAPSRAFGARQAVLGLIALLCVAPTVVRSDRGGTAAWDEADFLARAVCVSRAVHGLDGHALLACLGAAKRSPALTLLALPWGTAANSEWGLGLIVVSFRLLEFGLVVAAFTLLRRLRIPPLLVIVAGLSLALTPLLRRHAGAIMADVSFSWVALLTLLLCPLETATLPGSTWKDDLRRGALWGALLGLGMGEKATFAAFAATIGPAVLALRWRRQGLRSAIRTSLFAVAVAAPGLTLVVICWKQMVAHAQLAVAGPYAAKYSFGMGSLQYLAHSIAEAPLVAAIGAAGAAAAWAWRRRSPLLLPAAYSLAALLLYCALVVASPNHDERFMIPVLVAVPFLAILPWARSAEQAANPIGAGATPLLLTAGALLALPAVADYDFSNVAEQARMIRDLPAERGVLLLATDSPTLDIDTLSLALELAPERKPWVGIDTVVYDEADAHDLAYSFAKIERSHYMVLESEGSRLQPDWTNRHVAEWRRIARERGVLVPRLGARGFDVYDLREVRRVDGATTTSAPADAAAQPR